MAGCPANTHYSGTGASSNTSCICDAGYSYGAGSQQLSRKLHNTTRLSPLSAHLSPFQHSSSALRASDLRNSPPQLPQCVPFA